MTPQELKNSILQLAIQGKLVEQRSDEGTAEELCEQIQSERQKLIKARVIKKGPLLERAEDEKPFDIPETWIWKRLPEITYTVGNKNNQILSNDVRTQGKYPAVSQGANLIDGYTNVENKVISDLPLVMFGDHTRNVKFIDFPFVISADGTKFMKCICIEAKYLFYWLLFTAEHLRNRGYARHYSLLVKKSVPIPPLAEQKRIVSKIEELLPYIVRYEQAWSKLESFNKRFPTDMQKSILQMAIQGKLVAQRPEEGTGEELYQQILKKRKSLKHLVPLKDEEFPFEIPANWFWVRLGDVLIIERGGSPRPINDYLTDAADGINWIKIGDADKGGKYINNTHDKIIPEGMKKSRFVHKGDFLLSNSMSFGRPYILNIDGCIHDGWLVLHPIIELFIKDYLYYLLSSSMAFQQFCSRVAGAVVNNLNSEKVALTVIPVPPLAEQKRIIAKIEELLPLCEKLK